MTDRLFPVEPVDPPEVLSATRRLTLRNNWMLANGTHPATGRPLIPTHTCGECAHFVASGEYSKTYFKCDIHRLGSSRSAASDIRQTWPACDQYEPKETQ